MYVRSGLGQASGFTRPNTRILRMPHIITKRGRGFGATGGDPNSCTSPNYWNYGKSICCAPLGTPAGQDPCSILNDPGYIAAQNQDVGPLGPNGVPLSSPNFGPGPNNLADIANLPNNVQNDVMECYENPGASFIDSVGMQVNCPAQSTAAAPGIFVSAFSYAQLAQMLGPSITPTTQFVGNQPFAITPYVQAPNVPAGGYIPSSTTYHASVSMSGSSFNVGDSWKITVTGAPNSQVSASATQNGTSLGTTPMGTIGSNGSLVLTGTFTASQVGSWTENWTVAGQNAGMVSFTVAAPAGGGTGSGNGGTGAGSGSNGGNGGSSSTDTANPFAFLTNTVSLFGTSIPIWGLGGGVLAALWLMGRKG